MASPQQFSLRWNNYLRHITLAFDSLRSQEDLVDVTLSCEGRKIRAHKVLLSACSSYFREIFKENPCQHPVIIFKNVKYEDLTAIIEFMYQGEVNVVQESLPSFLHTAELLSVQGLTETANREKDLIEAAETVSLERQTVVGQLAETSDGIINTSECTLKPIDLQTFPEQLPPKRSRFEQILNSNNTKTESIRQTHSMNTSVDNHQSLHHQQQQQLHHENDDIQFTETKMKIELPEEYSEMAEDNVDVQIQAVEDMEQKSVGYMAYESYETTNDDQTGNEHDKHDTDENKGDFHEGQETLLAHEIDPAEMSRILTGQTSGEMSRGQDQTKKDKDNYCIVCNRYFISLSTLKRHRESKHEYPRDLNGHFCTFCDTTFKTKWSLSTHNSRFHRNKDETNLTSSTN